MCVCLCVLPINSGIGAESSDMKVAARAPPRIMSCWRAFGLAGRGRVRGYQTVQQRTRSWAGFPDRPRGRRRRLVMISAPTTLSLHAFSEALKRSTLLRLRSRFQELRFPPWGMPVTLSV